MEIGLRLAKQEVSGKLENKQQWLRQQVGSTSNPSPPFTPPHAVIRKCSNSGPTMCSIYWTSVRTTNRWHQNNNNKIKQEEKVSEVWTTDRPPTDRPPTDRVSSPQRSGQTDRLTLALLLFLFLTFWKQKPTSLRDQWNVLHVLHVSDPGIQAGYENNYRLK